MANDGARGMASRRLQRVQGGGRSPHRPLPVYPHKLTCGPPSRPNSSFRKMALLINRGDTAMTDLASFLPNAVRREPWNKGKLIGPKPPLRPKHVWSIRTKLQIDGRL